MRPRLTCVLCLAVASCAWAAAPHDPLPDMRWVFDRAMRADADRGADRLRRVRSWALVRLLYPHDEPGTECDDVWRMVALDALSRLNARAAGFPPPRSALVEATAPRDPLPDILAVRGIDDAGAVRIAEVRRPGSGLAAGDRILACDGWPVDGAAGLARRLVAVAASGRIVLGLDGGRSLDLLPGAAGPVLQRAAWSGTLEPWEGARSWELPAIDGAWWIAGLADPGLTLTVGDAPLQAPPGSARRSAVTGPERTRLSVRQTGGGGGSFTCAVVPLRGAWRRIRLDALAPAHRTCIGVRAGQAVVVESVSSAPHLLHLQGPGSEHWDALPAAPGQRQRIVLHGDARALAPQAVEGNGLLTLTVASASGDPADIDLRILLPDHAWTPAGNPPP